MTCHFVVSNYNKNDSKHPCVIATVIQNTIRATNLIQNIVAKYIILISLSDNKGNSHCDSRV